MFKPSKVPFVIVCIINKIIIDPIWILWSFLINLGYWVAMYKFYKGTWFENINKMDDIRREVADIADIKNQLARFKWNPDRWFDWIPWTITLFASDFKDDCDGASVFGKFLFNCIGAKSRRIKLIETFDTWKFWKWDGHIIQVTNDHIWFITNNSLIYIKDMNTWKKFIYDYFKTQDNSDYTWII